jgi:hypothetical protein
LCSRRSSRDHSVEVRLRLRIDSEGLRIDAHRLPKSLPERVVHPTAFGCIAIHALIAATSASRVLSEPRTGWKEMKS